ncbi:unnamed protein product [Urochloa decumbens]|uniref:F-box domain-containing protein n=1 Tax=Urochloa decumbens TaxID=240449 RepID=A0ABC9BKV7_9POAL
MFGRAAKGILGSRGATSGTDAAAAAHCVPALPPDLLAEILARVPPDVSFLFRCALVCKRWRGLLGDPAFLRRLFPDAGRSSLLGFFVQRKRPSVTAWRTVANIFNFKSRVPAFVPAPGSALGPRRRFLTSFVSSAAAASGLLDNAEPLAERGGLVLLRVFPHGAGGGHKMFSLCVCSLLTGKLDVLQPLDAAACFDGEVVRGYAVLPSGDLGPVPQQQTADGYSNLCQVLLVGVDSGGKQLNVHSFSTTATAPQNWLIGTAYFFTGDAGLISGPFGSNVATVCCGTAHWLFQLNDPTTGPAMFTVDVNAHIGEVCAYKRPVDWSNAGHVRLLYQKDNRLVLRTVQGQDEMLLATMCVAEKSDTALMFLSSYPGHAYLLDLQSKSTTMLAGWSESFNYKTAVPFEINWPELFMSRLGVQM